MPSAKPELQPAPFSGFPTEALHFFREIAKNNNKEWYDAHAEDYKRHVIAPAQSFVAEVGQRLSKLEPGIGYALDPNGRGSIKKIQTDRRFNPEREPYKTSLQILFWEGPLKVRKENSALYLKLDPQGLLFAGGLKYFERPTLAAYRKALMDDQRAAALHKLVQSLEKSGFALGGGGAFKKLPPGVPAESKFAPYFLHEGIFASIELPLGPEIHSPRLVEVALAHYKALLPLHRWCVKVLGDL